MGDKVWSEEEWVWVVFLMDFAFYAEYHRSISGLMYVKGEHGPLLAPGSDMESGAGWRVMFEGMPENIVFERVCEACEKLSREEIQRVIQGSPAYVLTNMGEVIDYELAYYGAGMDMEEVESDPCDSDPEFIRALRKMAEGAGE